MKNKSNQQTQSQDNYEVPHLQKLFYCPTKANKIVVCVKSLIKAFFNLDIILQPSPESHKSDAAKTIETQHISLLIKAPVIQQLISSACGPHV